MKRVLTFVAAGALLMGLAGTADAGIALPPQLAVTPNPATTADPVTIGNQPGDANTCEKGEVFYAVVKVGAEGEGAVAAGTIVPDPNGEGDWSVIIDPIPVAGDFTVSADCTGEPDEEDQLLAVADFTYDDVVLTVTQVETPTTPSSSTATTAAVAPATRPSFTG